MILKGEIHERQKTHFIVKTKHISYSVASDSEEYRDKEDTIKKNKVIQEELTEGKQGEY